MILTRCELMRLPLGASLIVVVKRRRRFLFTRTTRIVLNLHLIYCIIRSYYNNSRSCPTLFNVQPPRIIVLFTTVLGGAIRIRSSRILCSIHCTFLLSPHYDHSSPQHMIMIFIHSCYWSFILLEEVVVECPRVINSPTAMVFITSLNGAARY